jgi:competence protein ComEC
LRRVLWGFAIGAAWQQHAGSLPAPATYGYALAAGALVLGAVFRLCRDIPASRATTRWLVIMLLSIEAGSAWATWRAARRMAVELPLAFEGRDLQVEGCVAGLPVATDDGLRFAFEIERGIPDIGGFPRRVQLHLHARTGVTRVRPGESWRFAVRLRRVHRALNFHAPNVEAGMLERGLRATGYVRERPAPSFMTPPALRCTARHGGMRLEALRLAIRERVEAALPVAPHLGVIVALAIGDQSLISDADRRRFVRTGTGHLIAVSGLHVSLVAGALAALVSLAWRRLPGLAGRAPLWWAAPHASAVAGALAALAYAGLAGFGVPALRAFTMLASAAVATIAGRQLAASTVFAWALGVVTLVDPWAALSAGFWLSFGAVAAILFATSGYVDGRGRSEPARSRQSDWPNPPNPSNRSDPPNPPNPPNRSDPADPKDPKDRYDRMDRAAPPAPLRWSALSAALDRLRAAWRIASRTQWAVTIALIPLTLFWFAQIPLVGPLANAVAIPWASLVVTPLTLAGVVMPAPFDVWAWHAAHLALVVMMSLLGWLGEPAWAVLPLRAPTLVALVLATAGAIWWLAPPGWPLRAMAWILWLPLFVPDEQRPEPGEFRLTVFDVGQGGAVLVETHAHRLLFDTGPRYGIDSDAARAIVLPAFAAAGIGRLDRLVISHADADHAGGAKSLVDAIRIDSLRASLARDDPLWRGGKGDTSDTSEKGEKGEKGERADTGIKASDARACRAGESWKWDGIRFAMLWPDAATVGRGQARNAASCVLHVSNGRVAALLPGDIEAAQERALVEAGPAALRADLLLAPHHGSRTSSTEPFLDAVAPREVVFQVGYANRFGHPHPRVAARYAAHGARMHRSDRDGAIRASSRQDRFVIERCRELHRRYWMGR